jgi:S1-C subfamily serine protease
VNSRGEVVGISEAYTPPQSGAVALGFAIPAGIRPGDVLTRLDGDELASPEDLLLAALRSKSPGQTVAVEFRRGTTQQEVKVLLAARSAS